MRSKDEKINARHKKTIKIFLILISNINSRKARVKILGLWIRTHITAIVPAMNNFFCARQPHIRKTKQIASDCFNVLT